MTSSLHGSFEPDSKNTNQLIKTAVINLLSRNFPDWVGIIKFPNCQSLKWLRLRGFYSPRRKISFCSVKYTKMT